MLDHRFVRHRPAAHPFEILQAGRQRRLVVAARRHVAGDQPEAVAGAERADRRRRLAWRRDVAQRGPPGTSHEAVHVGERGRSLRSDRSGRSGRSGRSSVRSGRSVVGVRVVPGVRVVRAAFDAASGSCRDVSPVRVGVTIAPVGVVVTIPDGGGMRIVGSWKSPDTVASIWNVLSAAVSIGSRRRTPAARPPFAPLLDLADAREQVGLDVRRTPRPRSRPSRGASRPRAAARAAPCRRSSRPRRR